MKQSFFHIKTAWENFRHFASETNLWKEERCAWLDPKGKHVAQGASSEHGETKRGEFTPWDKFLEIQKHVLAGIPDKVLSDLDRLAKDPGKMSSYIKSHRDEIVKMIDKETGHDKLAIKEFKRLIDAEEVKSEQIRMKIEEVFAKSKKPEDDAESLKVLAKHKAPEGKEDEEDKKTRWKALLEHLAKVTHPLYRRIASFLRRPSVESFGISPEEVFEKLKDPGKRMELLRELADHRHDLVLEDAANVEDRLGALADLYAILSHSMYWLSPEERVELYEIMARVGAAQDVLKGERDRLEEPIEQTDDEKNKMEISHSEEIVMFIKNESDNKDRKIGGDNGLQKRLEKKGYNSAMQPNVFTLFSDGLKGGGWIDAMPVSESLKYTCTLIALEESAVLHRLIAYGKRSEFKGGVQGLFWHMRNVMLEFVRSGVRGSREKTTVLEVTNETTEQAKADFEVLRNRVERANAPLQSNVRLRSDVDELLVIYAWITHLDPFFDPKEKTKQKLLNWRKNAEADSSELKEEEMRARDELELSLRDFAPLEIQVLKNDDLNTLLAALTEVMGEQKLEEWSELRKHIENPTAKDVLRSTRIPDFLFEPAEEEYVHDRNKILQKAGTDGASNDLKYLDDEYMKKNAMRRVLHKAYVKGAVSGIVSVIEATVKARAAELQENFVSQVSGRDKYSDEELSSITNLIDALSKLKKSNLRASTVPLEHASTDVGQLSSLANDVKNFERDEAKRKKRAEQNKSDAAEILKNDRIPKSIKETAKSVADGSAVLSNSRPIGLFGNEKVANAVDSALSQNVEEVSELNDKYQQVSSRINSLLPKYRGENADPLFYKAEDRLREEMRGITAKLRAAPNAGDKAEELLKSAGTSIENLEEFIEILESAIEQEPLDEKRFAEHIRNEPTLRDKKPEFVWGVYDRTKRKIYLNEAVLEEYGDKARKMVMIHEGRHAFHDALRQVFPMFLVEAYNSIAPYSPEVAKRCTRLAKMEGLTKDEWKDEAMDELLVRQFAYSEMQDEIHEHGKFPPGLRVSAKDVEVFESLETSLGRLDFSGGKKRLSGRKMIAADGDEGDVAADAGTTAVADAEDDRPSQTVATGERDPDFQPPPYVENTRITDDFEQVRQGFVKIDAFLESDSVQRTAGNLTRVSELKTELENVKQIYDDQDVEEDLAYKERVGALKANVKTITNMIAERDAWERDLRDAPEEQNIFKAIWNSTEFMSIHSFIAIYKSIVEDVKRQMERREQGRIGRVGKGLTEWISKVPLLREIPYINTLSVEFQRREKSSENEEVEKYKSALVEIDSYELQAMLHHPTNRDHMKAILHLLGERGRIDWNDTKFWEALSSFSRYNIPIKACERNETLKEDWLRKVISDIWNDDDLYRQWKTKNDSSIESEKKNFTPEADRLSNLADGLNGELRKQLRMFKEAKERSEPIPNDVQPHIYEEIIDYSIRNGKMTMEEKFFYLVQGVAEGLIGADRLRTLAGEKGGVLNIFPFIDYFYKRNNTLPEIQALAKRLREDNDWKSDAFYRPGLKTTIWLELEVAREESVKQRLGKGIDKRGGEMDHDDMHFFLPRLDFEELDNLAKPQGGGRQQLSGDGWLNGYVGFNSYIKSLGTLVQLEEDGVGGAKFGSQDAEQVIKAAASFVRMDSILIGRSGFNEARRPKISWGEMKTSMPVAGNHVANEYRKRMEKFTRELILAYQDDEMNEQFVDEMLISTEGVELGEDATRKVEHHSKVLQDKLSQVIKRKGLGPMREVLQRNFRDMISHSEIEEEFTYDNVRNIWEEQRQASSN